MIAKPAIALPAYAESYGGPVSRHSSTAIGGGFLAKAGKKLGIALILGGAFFSWAARGPAAEARNGYQFQEGEPLAYRLKVAVARQRSIDRQNIPEAGQRKHDSEENTEVDCQLMPISQRQDGAWKIRLVLDKVEQEISREGDLKKTSFDRQALKRLSNQSDIGSIDFNAKNFGAMVDEFFSRSDKKGSKEGPKQEAKTEKTPPPPPSDPEELFEQPILAFIAPDGDLKEFEDRTELKQVLPNLNLKECLRLMMPVLPDQALKAGLTWKRRVAIDLPGALSEDIPLVGGAARTRAGGSSKAWPGDHQHGAPLDLELAYEIKHMETADGCACARIAFSGQASREGMMVPIHREEYKFLIWTTYMTRIEEKVKGECLFNLEKGTVGEVRVDDDYSLSTLAGRREDDFRGRILTENQMRTHFESRPVPASKTVPLADNHQPDATIKKGP